MPIPRRIVQTHRSASWGVSWRRSWQRLHPDFDYAFLDDAQCRAFVGERLPGLLATYDKLALPVQRADVFRYAFIYEFGGVYADVDTVCLARLDSYIDLDRDHLVVGLEMSPAEFPLRADLYAQMYCQPMQILQWTFAASPRHPALLAVLEQLRAQVEGMSVQELQRLSLSDRATLALTGPMAFTEALLRYMAKGDPPSESVTVLPRSTWGCWPGERGNPAHPPRVRHLFEGSWKRQPVRPDQTPMGGEGRVGSVGRGRVSADGTPGLP